MQGGESPPKAARLGDHRTAENVSEDCRVLTVGEVWDECRRVMKESGRLEQMVSDLKKEVKERDVVIKERDAVINNVHNVLHSTVSGDKAFGSFDTYDIPPAMKTLGFMTTLYFENMQDMVNAFKLIWPEMTDYDIQRARLQFYPNSKSEAQRDFHKRRREKLFRDQVDIERQHRQDP